MSSQFNLKQHLGRKTYWLFFLKNAVGAIIFFFILLVFIILASVGSSVESIHAFLILGVLSSSFLFLLLLTIAALWTWLEYHHYTFILDDHALEISRGVFNKENISIPYHHIEDVNLEQSLLYQLLGVCRLIIQTAGSANSDHDDDGHHSHAEGTLPAIDLQMGREIQKIIMHRSNFQEVIMKSKVIGPTTDQV